MREYRLPWPPEMLCWHFTLAVCCKSHQYRSAPEETFFKENENKLLALDQTLTSAAQSGESKIWTPCCYFESFQTFPQAGKLFYFDKTSSEPPGCGCLPVHAAVQASGQVRADSLGSRRAACTAAILSPKHQQHVLRCLLGKPFQISSPSCLHSPAPSYPRLLQNLLMFRAEGEPAWEGKLQSETLSCWLLFSNRVQVSRKV